MSDFIGWIVDESLENKRVLEKVTIEKTHEVKNEAPGYPNVWHIHRVSVKRELIHEITALLRRHLKKKWYAHFVDDGNMLIMVFHNTAFFLKKDDKEHWKKAIDHGVKVGVNKNFFEGIPLA